jgi:hypothetical protein
MPARRVDRRLQCSVSTADHSQGTVKVPDDPTARCHAVDRVRRGRMTIHDVPYAIEDIICYF